MHRTGRERDREGAKETERGRERDRETPRFRETVRDKGRDRERWREKEIVLLRIAAAKYIPSHILSLDVTLMFLHREIGGAHAGILNTGGPL